MNKKILIVLIALTAVALIAFIIANQKFPQKPEITKQELQQEFQTLKTKYEQVKAQGYDVSEAEKLARDAKQAFDNRDYKKAKEFLDRAFAVLRKVTSTANYSSSALSQVKVAIVYERLNDARPKRSIDEQLQILKDTKADMIFRASWRWNPLPDSCSAGDIAKVTFKKPEDVTSELKQACIDSGYSFEDMKNTISEIKKQNPNIIIIGGIPAQKINKKEVNEITGETFTETQTWGMALDPAKWGITSPTKEELQNSLKTLSGYPESYYPDITNPKYQELFISWAERQIDSGMDGIWIDLLYTQAGKLQGITKDVNHPAVRASYEAASKLVDEIHNYGESKGKHIYVGSWTTPMYYPYTPPKLDFVTETMGPRELMEKKYEETKWKNTASKAKEKFGNIPLFVIFDWGFRNSPIEIVSQQMSQADAQNFLRLSDDFFTSLGIKFVYPVHGASMVVQQTSATKLAYGTLNWYDSLAPEFQTYETIKQLAQNKSNKK